MRLIFTVFALIFTFQLKAQDKNIHTSFSLEVSENQKLTQKVGFLFTAIALKSKQKIDFSEIAFIYNADTLFFNNDFHGSEDLEYNYSSLIHFDDEVSTLELYSTGEFTNLEVVLVNGSGEYSDYSAKTESSIENNDCELTDVIQQSEWRAGLPEPTYSRSFTTIENMIVHHSAGSNNISDYTQAVRDIYILHTVENGWSDIGYNYLVAPNGVIYAGRDPGEGEQDNVMGAHFCGSNSNTMGVCLLGNYETIEPTTQLLESLERILSWKSLKENLEPLASNSHPLNTNLGVIAGHQDGCNTLCPGENVYKRLQDIRVKINEQLAICLGEENEEEEEEEGENEEPDEEVVIIEVEKDIQLNSIIYPNPIKGDFSFSINLPDDRMDQIQFIRIFNQNGKSISWTNLYLSENTIEVKLPLTLNPGLYFLQTSYKDGEQSSQRFVIQ